MGKKNMNEYLNGNEYLFLILLEVKRQDGKEKGMERFYCDKGLKQEQ